jgi:hypothetical protein
MNAIARIVLFTGILFSSVTRAGAQSDHYHFEGGINAGTLLYQGDLIRSQLGSFKGAKPMLQVWLAKPFTPYLSWRASLLYGSVSADESSFSTPVWKRLRNFSFSSPVTEISAVLQYNLYGDNGQETYHTLTPYLMAGAGMSFLNIKRDWSRLDTTAFNSKSQTQTGLGTDTLHALPGVLPVIPVGAGVRWKVTPRFALNAEVTMRFSFSDYLDGFSYAANNKANDSYYSLSLGASFVLGGGNWLKCPKVRK